MSITSLRGSTLPNRSFSAGKAKTKDVVRIAPDTATTFSNGAAISSGGGGGGGPTISNVLVTDSSYILSNTTPYIDSTGGYIKITGTGFAAGCTAYVSGTPATSTTFVSATEVRAQVGAASSNAQSVYVVNTDSSVGILLNAITYSGTPSWSTSATLSSQVSDTAFSISLSATSDSSITYSLASGSGVPPGTTLYSNGTFAGTVTGISSDTNYSFTVVATDVENQLSTRAFTVSVSSGDQYFYITPLLLSGDTNVWITDSSTNKFLPTISGDVKPTAFSPYNSNWSAYFDGTGDYLSIASNAAFAYGTGDFTIEFWAFPTTYSPRNFFFDGTTTDPSATIQLSTDSSGFLILYVNGSIRIQHTGTAVSLNAWHHIAVSRVSGSTRMFLDGAQVGSTYADTNSYITAPLIVMHNFNLSTGSIGSISNLRVVKGVGAYTGNFTVPTTALATTQSSGANIAAITSGQTVLLTCNSNRFVDTSASPLTITKNGDAAIKSFGPFAESDATTGSGYFDGSGDYLQYASNSAFAFGTGTYTVEAWVYILSVPGSAAAVFDAGSATGSFGLSIINTTRNLFVNTYGTGQLSTLVTSTGIPLNVWTHVAVCRASTASNDTRLFINGVLDGTGTDATNWTVTTTPMVGYNAGGANYYFSGYMTDMRVIKGSALYTANFTPPTSSLSSVANTQLLTLQYRRGENNHRFVDESGKKSIVTRTGNPSQGTFSPFSPAGWSHYFDGSSYYDFTASTTFNEFLTGDFTVECWVYYTGTDSFSGNPTVLAVVATWSTAVSYEIEVQSGGVVRFAAGNSIPIDLRSSGAGLLTANRWYHVAAARASGVTRLFINGANVAAHSGSVSISQAATNMRIGGFPGGGNRWTGYVSDLRIVKGQAAYTANFTPATSSLSTTSQSITSANVFLGCNTNRFIDANTTPKTISSFTSAPKVQAFSPFRASASYTPATHGGSVYFDGTGDYISTTLSPVLTLGTSNHTIEFWMYPNGTQGSYGVVWEYSAGSSQQATNDYYFAINNTGTAITLLLGGGGSWTVDIQLTSGEYGAALNNWSHVVITRSGTAFRLFINGVLKGYTTSSQSIAAQSGAMLIGQDGSGNGFTGYVSNFNMIVGSIPVAYQTASTTTGTIIFTPPTAPSAISANTIVYNSFTQGGIIDATGRHNFETLGDAKISNVSSKFGLGSLYFDGTSDGLYEPYNPQYAFGTGDFTIEFWINQSSKTGLQTIVAFGYVPITQNGWTVQTGDGTGNIVFYYHTSGGAQVAIATESGSTVNTGTWYHIAVVRTGGNTKIYRNGTQVATGADTTVYSPATTVSLYIGGGSYVNFGNYFLNGYLDDLRITRYARYTGAFTAPTTAFLTK
jgi:hypothetical protein